MLMSFAQALARQLPPLPPLEGGAPAQTWAPPIGPPIPRAAPGEIAPLPVAMQVCLPAQLWNWPDDSPGSVSSVLYEFCSWVPELSSDWGRYEPSSQRLADAYALFLSALTPGPAVSGAQEALTAPANLTQVIYPNGSMMMPAWIVTQKWRDFVNGAAGRPDLAATIVVDLTGGDDDAALFSVGKGAAQTTPVPLAAGQVRRVEFHADAWDNVPVRPAAWFNGALVGLYSGGPFAGGLTRDRFFGPQGILRAMMTGLRVGLNVSVVATMSETGAAQVQDAARTGEAIRVVGLDYRADAMTVSEQGGMHQVRLPSSAAISAAGKVTASTPMIVGVDVSGLG